MPGPQTDASFLAILTAWIAAAVAAVFSWVWLHTMGRIKAVEKDKLDRAEFDKHVIRAEAATNEVKSSIHEVSQKLDLFKDDVGRKFDELKNLILEQRK